MEKKDLVNFDKFYDQNYAFSGNNMTFVKKVLNRNDNNNNTTQLTRQKTHSTISVDKSSNPSLNNNMINTGSNEGRFLLKKIYSTSTRININIFKYHSIFIIKYTYLHKIYLFRISKE